jgi:hypothetical protein
LLGEQPLGALEPATGDRAEDRSKASCQRHRRTADRAELKMVSSDRWTGTSSTVAGGTGTGGGAGPFEGRGQSSSGSWRRIAAWSCPNAGLGSMPSCSTSVSRTSAYARSAEMRALRRLARPDITIIGLDHSPALIDAARRLTAEEGLADNVAYQVGDGPAERSPSSTETTPRSPSATPTTRSPRRSRRS